MRCLGLPPAVGALMLVVAATDGFLLPSTSPPRLPTRLAATKPAAASPFQSLFAPRPKAPTAGSKSKEGRGVTQVRLYFDYWNKRQMEAACDLFTEDCSYEDTLYAGAFVGKDALRKHLLRVANALPDSFSFVLDDVSDGGDSIGVRWHVESEGKQLPFTRGTSIYKVDPASGKINYGFDVPEPTVKSGGFSLAILSLVGRLLDEPLKAVPLGGFLFYCWFVFLSNVAPGPNALSLDPGTWAEVRDLSLNFWLVMPAFAPESSPVLHPCLEGLFNFLLAWAALFAGFMVDGKVASSTAAVTEEPDKAKNGFLPYVLGMQLLTNAIYLPYLVARKKPWTPAQEEGGYTLTKAEVFGESKLPPVVFTVIGVLSLAWAVLAREDGFGADRFATFGQILSSDRLTFSFVVDLLYFWGFQGWLMDDDLKRRGGEAKKASAVFKAVPFMGLAGYLLTRPKLLPGGGKDEA